MLPKLVEASFTLKLTMVSLFTSQVAKNSLVLVSTLGHPVQSARSDRPHDAKPSTFLRVLGVMH